MSIKLKESGDGEILPLGIIKTGLVESLWGILMVLHETEAPHALHREVAGRLRLLTGTSQRFTLESKKVSTTSLTVLLILLRIPPLGILFACPCRNSRRGDK